MLNVSNCCLHYFSILWTFSLNFPPVAFYTVFFSGVIHRCLWFGLSNEAKLSCFRLFHNSRITVGKWKNREREMVNKAGPHQLTNHMTRDHIASHKIETNLTLCSSPSPSCLWIFFFPWFLIGWSPMLSVLTQTLSLSFPFQSKSEKQKWQRLLQGLDRTLDFYQPLYLTI